MQSETWGGEVVRISPTADEQTRTFAAYLLVDNTRQSHPLVPGTFVKATVQGPRHTNRILVPRGAIRSGRVFVVENGVAQTRPLTVERFLEDRALIRGDLHDGDRIILSHLDRLADGSPVRVSDEQAASATASTRPEKGADLSTP
jgi:membrane fusion protein (multidrug efflux system)